MRQDMLKVTVERPRRVPAWGTTRGRPPRDTEEAPNHEGMRRPHRDFYKQKELNENLAPLRRYLFKQVGRPWNKVYSEFRGQLRADSTVQEHVLRHLGDFVSIRAVRGPVGWMRDRSMLGWTSAPRAPSAPREFSYPKP